MQLKLCTESLWLLRKEAGGLWLWLLVGVGLGWAKARETGNALGHSALVQSRGWQCWELG